MDNELKEASRMFKLGNSEWKLIKSQINYIYENKSKILQFTPLEYKSTRELLIEVNWIEYLNKNGFEVVEIVKSRNNNLLEEINGYLVICYEKIIGKKAGKSDWNNSFFQKLGRFTGKLHRLGKSFETKNEYNYKNWDEISKGKFVEYLPHDERNLVEVYKSLRALFNSYEINDNNYGLVHYDIHHENYYLRGSSEKIILSDFEMTCRSWYINDISIILYYILNSTPQEKHKIISELFLNAFFKGYRKEFSIDESEKKKIPKFLLYRDLLVYGYTFRIWKEEANMTDNEIKFRNKLSDSITKRMRFNFFKSKNKKVIPILKEEVDDMGFTQHELKEYDQHVDFFYTNLINALILYTYEEKELHNMAPILFDPLTELYEELDYAFTTILFETVFKNKLIDAQFKDNLLEFKAKVDNIPNEIWDWKFLDNHEVWLGIRSEANELLNKLEIKSRTYNTDYIKY